jgi:PIN domain nuclease of toxin-antitoxin system
VETPQKEGRRVTAVLDTHAALYLALGSRALGTAAQRLLSGAAPADLVISDVTLTETARLLNAGSLTAAGGSVLAWLEKFALGYRVQSVAPAIAWKAAAYTFAHRDPCDRHILATADVLALPLVTVDRTLAAAAAIVGVRVIW